MRLVIVAFFITLADDCKVKWKNLREVYVKKKKQLKTKSSQAAKKMNPWEVFQERKLV